MKIIERTVSKGSLAWQWILANASFSHTGNDLFPDGEQKFIVEYDPVELHSQIGPVSPEIMEAFYECGAEGGDYVLFIGS